MATYKSGEAVIPAGINNIFNRISNPSLLKDLAAKAPADVAQKLGQVSFSDDSIAFNVPPVGQITLQLTEKTEPSKVVYRAVQTPVPFGISMTLKPIDDSHTAAEAIIDIDIPVFLKPMLDGKMNEMAQQFRSLMAHMAF